MQAKWGDLLNSRGILSSDPGCLSTRYRYVIIRQVNLFMTDKEEAINAEGLKSGIVH